MSMYEVDEAAKAITDSADKDANVIFGAIIDEAMQGEIKITVIATGFGDRPRKKKEEEKPQVTQMGEPGAFRPSSSIQSGPVRPTASVFSSETIQDEPSDSEDKSEEDNKELEVPAFIRRKLK
ncbi:MAG: hypothetical protein ABH837_02215, partial [bacterium]